MPHAIRKHLRLHADDLNELEQLAKSRGHTLSLETNTAIREYLQRQKAQHEEHLMTPVWERLLHERFDQLEAWLRSGTWAGATYSATAALLLLELMCGKKLDPAQAKEHFELIRGRAWKIVRRDPGEGA